MKNIVIITPVYNDWESFVKLIKEIDKSPKIFTEWFKIYMKKYSNDILG